MAFAFWFWSGALLLAWTLCRRSITLGDEGYMLSQALDVVNGKVPYRDLDLFVTPGVWYLNAAVFKIFGVSVVATRVVAGLALVATMAVARWVIAEAGRDTVPQPSLHRWSYFGAALVGVFSAWAFPAWTISFYSPYATLASLTALGCLLVAQRLRSVGWALACGLSLGVAVAFKQNYGVLAGIGCGLALLLDAGVSRWSARPRTTMRDVVRLAAAMFLGALLVAVPMALALWAAGALPAAIDSMVVRPFHEFATSHSVRYLNLDDLWRRTQVWEIGGLRYLSAPMMRAMMADEFSHRVETLVLTLHTLLYWLPWLAFASAAAAAVRAVVRRSATHRTIVSVGTFAAVYFLGVFPRADFNHLVNVYQPVLVLMVCGASRLFAAGGWRVGVVRPVVAGSAAVAVGLYVAFAGVWLRDLQQTLSTPIDSLRAGVLVDPDVAASLNEQIEVLHAMTKPGEPVFALSSLSMVPFLAERPMPSRYYNYLSVHVGHDAGRSAAQEIQTSGARILLAQTADFFADSHGVLDFAPDLARYVRDTFGPVRTIGARSVEVWERRAEPLAPADGDWMWPACEIPEDAASGQFVKRELFVRSLVHDYGRARAGTVEQPAGMVTRCQVVVQPGGRLRIRVEPQQSVAADFPIQASAEVWVQSEGMSPQRVLTQEWILQTELSPSAVAAQEYVVDLAPLAGKTVTLELRSELAGPSPKGRAGEDGFAVVWSRASLESERAPL